MNGLELLSIHNPEFIKFVYEKFNSNCVACVPGIIWKYIKNNFQYVEDYPDEKIIAPYLLIKIKKGDCDDFALFSKTVLDILGGWQTNYYLLGRERNKFTHIVTRAKRIGNLFNINDTVIIDGANEEFNSISNQYIFRKIVR